MNSLTREQQPPQNSTRDTNANSLRPCSVRHGSTAQTVPPMQAQSAEIADPGRIPEDTPNRAAEETLEREKTTKHSQLEPSNWNGQGNIYRRNRRNFRWLSALNEAGLDRGGPTETILVKSPPTKPTIVGMVPRTTPHQMQPRKWT